MFANPKLLNNILKFSSAAITQYQLVKIAANISDITDTDITFNNKGLESSFSKFIDSVMKLEDILSGANIADEDTSNEEYMTEVIESIQFWSEKVKQDAQNMKLDDWLSEDTSDEELANFMISANESIDKSLETYAGMNINDLIEQNKANITNEQKEEIGAGIDKHDNIKGNLHFTGNLAESRLKANQKYMNKLQFLRKVNPQAPEWVAYKESVKRSQDKRRNLINSDPKLRAGWKELNNKKYKLRRSLNDTKIEDLEKDLARYKAQGENYNTSKLIERTENLLKKLKQRFAFTEGAREHQKEVKRRISDTESMMGCLRRITLKLQYNKTSIKNKLKEKYKKEWKDKFEAVKNDHQEIIKLQNKLDEIVKKDPKLLEHISNMKLIQDYTLRVKSVNMRQGDGVKPETVNIAINAVELGQQIIPKIESDYPSVANEIKLCNEIMTKQVKEILNISKEEAEMSATDLPDDLPPQTVYQPNVFDEDDESPDTIRDDNKFANIKNRMDKLKKLAQLNTDNISNMIDSVVDDAVDEVFNFDINFDI